MVRQTFILFCLLVGALLASATVHAGEVTAAAACVEAPQQGSASAPQDHEKAPENSQQNEDASHLPHQHGGCHGHHQSLDIAPYSAHDGWKGAAFLWPMERAASLLNLLNSALRPPIA